MKIGILTQPLHANYGGILQNFALQKVLKDMGHEVWTLDYNRFTWFDWFDNVSRVLIHKFFGRKDSFLETPNKMNHKEIPLRHFVNRYINITKPRTKRFNKRIFKKYSLDAVVVGSDQVWRPKYNLCIEDCFLKFASNLDIKRVAYAASFGTDEWEYTQQQTEHCAILSKRFNGISVREKSGVSLCEKYLGVTATHVLDPTLLLHSEDYVQLISQIPQREPFIFAYLLDKSEEKTKEVAEISTRIGLPYLIKGADNTISNNDSIELWLSYFRDAAFIVTDSFHGTAFSLIFNKDFFVFGNEKRGNSRFESLLDFFDLKDRMVKKVIPTQIDIINWKKVNEIREAAIIKSKLWLKQNL